MTSLQIQYFLSVAKMLSFSKAAELNYTSQPSVSRQIAALEKELGFPLFCRDTHNVYLTGSGELLYHELEYLTRRLSRVIDTARRESSAVSQLRIGYLKETNPSIISPFIQIFSQEYPKISLELDGYGFNTLKQCLVDGTVDIAFLLSFDCDDLPFVTQKKVCLTREHFMFSAKHRLAKKAELRLEDFQGEQVVIAKESDRGAAFALRQFERCGMSPQKVHTSNSSEAIDLYVEFSSAIGIMDTTNRIFLDPRYRFFEIPGDQAIVSLNAVWRSDNANPAIPLFSKLLPNIVTDGK